MGRVTGGLLTFLCQLCTCVQSQALEGRPGSGHITVNRWRGELQDKNRVTSVHLSTVRDVFTWYIASELEPIQVFLVWVELADRTSFVTKRVVYGVDLQCYVFMLHCNIQYLWFFSFDRSVHSIFTVNIVLFFLPKTTIWHDHNHKWIFPLEVGITWHPSIQCYCDTIIPYIHSLQ